MPLAVENVSYTYAPKTPFAEDALRDVSLAVRDGEFVGIMGRTGCGKSTLIQVLAGLLKPSAGRVLLDGADINDAGYARPRLRAAMGVVFQYPEYQLFETTVERDVAFALRYSGLSASERLARVREAVAMVGLDFDSVKEQSPMTLSGGEKRLVAIAGVLAARPRFLVFDEPVAGLDPLGRESFCELLIRLNRAGTTVLLVSHNAECIAAYCERVVVLDGGRVACDGAPERVFADVEKMTRLHIGVSEPRRIAYLLEKRGFPIAQNVVEYNALKDALLKSLTGGAPV